MCCPEEDIFLFLLCSLFCVIENNEDEFPNFIKFVICVPSVI